ncbi:MAG: LysM peptidoglycan-binding domain-containing protein [Bacteroides sp.]|nr:LysM peptidoglycan-binding domain-containing protein [Bacteroides sp.]
MKFIQTLYLAAAVAVMPFGRAEAQVSPNFFLHTVTKGQSLYSIASMYQVTVDEIVRLNPGSDERIKAGEALKIPQKEGNGQSAYHTIQPGETLYQLTVRYGVTAQDICKANPGLSAKNFRIGQVIAIPASSGKTETAEQQQVTPVATTSQDGPLKPKCRDMHRVERKETIYSISKQYGITKEELIAANPELRTQKLKRGKFLCIPYAKATSAGNKNESNTTQIPLSNAELFQQNQKESKKYTSIKAAVMLPFMTDGSGNREEQSRMVEYYEGFLMAVDSLKQQGVSVDIHTYDTGNTSASLSRLFSSRSELKDMDIIFGPAHTEQVKQMADFAEKHKIRLVVPFTSKSDEVFNNPYVFQVNTPQSYLFSEVYEHYLRKFPEANVIFLDADTGDNDKTDFIKGLKEELKNNQITFKELKGAAITPEGMKMAVDSLRENVLIPTSGKNISLIKILPQLIITAREHPNYDMKLFGYPEWQTYTYDHLSSFFELDTYFYSSFYTNNLFPEAVKFTSAYRKWYSKDMANTYPKYGMLGFDTGYFFLKALSHYGSDMEENMNKMMIAPIQTGFKFERVNNWGGFINRKVFFVRFTKNYELIKLDFE